MNHHPKKISLLCLICFFSSLLPIRLMGEAPAQNPVPLRSQLLRAQIKETTQGVTKREVPQRPSALPLKNDRLIKVEIERGTSKDAVSILTRGVGNVVSRVKADFNQPVTIHESHYFSSTVDVVLTQPKLGEEVLKGAPPATQSPEKIASDLAKWNATLAEWKKHFLKVSLIENYRVNVPIDSLNPCGLLSKEIPLNFGNQENYVQDPLAQGLPLLFDNVELVDPETGISWKAPLSLESKKALNGDKLRLMIRPVGQRLSFSLGYGSNTANFIGGSKIWEKVTPSAFSITKSVRQTPVGFESVFPKGYFLDQRSDSFFPKGWDTATNDLEAITVVSSNQDLAFKNAEGENQKTTLSLSALIASHSLRALKVVLPVTHYYPYALVRASRLRNLGKGIGYFQKDHLYLGKELTEEELKKLSEKGLNQRLITKYESKVLCLKSAQFNPKLTQDTWTSGH